MCTMNTAYTLHVRQGPARESAHGDATHGDLESGRLKYSVQCLLLSPAAPLQGSPQKLPGEKSGCSHRDLFLDVPASLTYSPNLPVTPRSTQTSR